MSITVRDCLKLPSLRDATVIAGHNGLDRYISTVSVLEYAKVFAMADQLFLGNELIITAFTSVKDDVEAQCEALRRLHGVGETEIILYYVGIYLPKVDQRLIDIANELSFPIILMPIGAYSYRYSEVITEVLMKIFEDRQKETRFVTNLLGQIFVMRERQRNIGGILRLLSDRCQYSFLLLDEDGKECGLATWPMAKDEEFLNEVYDLIEQETVFPATLLWKGCEYGVWHNYVRTPMRKEYQLFSIVEASILNMNYIEQAVEVLESSYDIWGNDLRKMVVDDLVRMVLNEQGGNIYRVADELHFDLKAMQIMWVVCPVTATKYSYTNMDRSKIKYMIKKFLQSNRKNCIVDTFDNSVVAFMDNAKYLELDKGLGKLFAEKLQEEFPGMALIWCGGMDSVVDARMAYILLEEHFSTACIIYPNKMIFTQRELSFSCSCYEAVYGDVATKERYLSVLKPLQGTRDEEDSLETLTTYLIDADRNTVKTAKILHVHESTVKYRLNKIKQKLGYDVAEMPGTYVLYQAVAMKRLMEKLKAY